MDNMKELENEDIDLVNIENKAKDTSNCSVYSSKSCSIKDFLKKIALVREVLIKKLIELIETENISKNVADYDFSWLNKIAYILNLNCFYIISKDKILIHKIVITQIDKENLSNIPLIFKGKLYGYIFYHPNNDTIAVTLKEIAFICSMILSYIKEAEQLTAIINRNKENYSKINNMIANLSKYDTDEYKKFEKLLKDELHITTNVPYNTKDTSQDCIPSDGIPSQDVYKNKDLVYTYMKDIRYFDK